VWIILGKATKIIGYIIGIPVFLFGLLFLAFALDQPVLFAGQYMIVAVMIMIFGFVIMYLGHRSGRKPHVSTA
jgi:ABC-type antimicrobial peptide transport system permease subunit